MPVDRATVSRLTRLRAPRGLPATPPALQQGQRAGPAPGGPPGSAGRSPLDHGPKVSPPRRRQRRWLPVFSPSYPEGRPVRFHGGRSRAGLTPGRTEPGTRRWETSGRRAHPGCGPQNAGVQGAAEERGEHACAQRGAPEAGEAVYVQVLGVSFLLPRGWACARSSQPQGPRSENPSKLRKPCIQTAGAGGPQGTWPGSGNKPAVPPPGTAALGQETDRRHFPQRGSEPAPRRGLGTAPSCARARAASGTLGAAGPPFLGLWFTSLHGHSQQDRPRAGADATHACIFSLASREAGLAHDPRKQMVRLMRQVRDAGYPETRVRGLGAAVWKWSLRPTGAAPTGSGAHSEHGPEPCPSPCACCCPKEP